MATSGRCSRTAASRARGVASLGDDIEPGLGEEAGDTLTEQDGIVGERDADRHVAAISARIAAPDSSSFGMKPRTRLASRRGP